MRRLAYICILLIFLFPQKASASLIINEIFYDAPGTDTDHEWVEIYNSGSSSVTLEGIKFNDGANHGLNPPGTNGSTGSMSIPAGGYAILSGNAAVFKNDYPGYDGTVIDTVMALANTGDTLSLVSADNATIDSLTYTSAQGAAGDGNSLQSFGSQLVSATPTPGEENTRESSVDEEDEEEIETEEDEEVDAILPTYAGTIMHREPITAGVPAEFRTLIVNPERKVVHPGRYLWSMGDGASYEYFEGKVVSHTYAEAGDYLVVLEYFHSRSGFIPDVISKKTIKVSENTVVVADITQHSVMLKNTSKVDIDLYQWKLVDGMNTFSFPKNTILLAGKTIAVPHRISQMIPNPYTTIALMHPTNALVASKSYGNVSKVAYVTPPDKEEVGSDSEEIVLSDENELLTEEGEDESEPSVLGVRVASGPVDPIDEDIKKSQTAAIQKGIDANSQRGNNKTLFYIVFGVLLIGAISLALYIDRKSRKDGSAEGEYDAEEFTIVE